KFLTPDFCHTVCQSLDKVLYQMQGLLLLTYCSIMYCTHTNRYIQTCCFFSLQIDDKEFDIPQVDTPPTLESILNEAEDEEELFILEDPALLNTDNIDAHSIETSSLASSDSGDRTHLRRKKVTEATSSIHGSVVRQSILKGVSAQIVSAAVVSNVIAVGTSHGLALIFDPNQALRLCLGSTSVGAQYGAVSALSINSDCTRLLCGFAKGQITMWDLANGKLLRTIMDAHPPGTAILHIKFTDDPTVAICNDSGGSVFELTFKRVMGTRTCESRCLFSGAKGEVCCIQPLLVKAELRDHPITQYGLLAMASLTKVLVIGLKPSLKVWLTFPYGKTNPASVPLLSWHFIAVQNAVTPMLAFCRGGTIHFLLVKKDESGAVHVSKQKQLHLSYELINLTWINSRTLALLDSAEKLHVVDRHSQEELEMVDMAEVQLVYNSSHFKSLATGGNVSQALALVGEKACYQSVGSYGAQIIYLGTKVNHHTSLLAFQERMDCLLKQERFTEVLALAWSFHEGKAKAVVGLFGDQSKRQGVIADRMVEILIQFADRALRKCPDQGKIQVMEQHFQDMVPVMVDYCLLLDRTDLLFGQIYSKLSEISVAKGVFIECLEPYVLTDKLTSITPQVMKDMLIHFQDKGMMETIEACIVHMDVTSLDIQQVVGMCWEHHLHDAMIYVYNRGMNDYIMPMEVRDCCLAGRAYPLGNIPEDLVPLVKNQVFEFLIRLHSTEVAPDEEIYPHIRTLLHFDTREFLNVLALTFENFQSDKQAVEHQQRIVDILLKVMVENSDFTPSQVGCLFTFLARQLAKPDNTLFVNRKLFDQVLEFLCSPDDESRHAERQQVRLASRVCYQVCEFMYEKQQLYDKIIFCYLNDPVRKEEIFNYVHNMLSIPGYSAEDKASVWSKTIEHSKDLVAINPSKAAELVATHFTTELGGLLCVFSRFYSGFICRDGGQVNRELQRNPQIHEKYIDLLCQFQPDRIPDFLRLSEHYRLEEATQITKRHQLHEATAYLLEKKGDVHGAFQVLLEMSQSALQNILEELVQATESTLEETIGLCQRNSHSLNQQQREALWFPLLEAVMSTQKLLKDGSSSPAFESLKHLTKQVLNSMTGFIALPSILQRILQDPMYGKGKLGEIQGLILGMLDTFNYEQTLLETTTNLLNHDLHWSLSNLRAAVSRGLNPKQEHCGICLQQYKRRQEGTEEVIVFSCGHIYHSQCLHNKNCGVQTDGQTRWLCYKCNSSNKGGRHRDMGSEVNRGRSTSLAQVRCYQVISASTSFTMSPTEMTLDLQQLQAFDELRRLYRGPSRLAILTELSRNRGGNKQGLLHATSTHSITNSIFQNENFQLRLSPPPLAEE
uniref:VPS8 subunit of CORVET complex n=1 Tax=Callorhinchus milii TaxID=7868 RepID=A0A4W3IW36_CALMI